MTLFERGLLCTPSPHLSVGWQDEPGPQHSVTGNQILSHPDTVWQHQSCRGNLLTHIIFLFGLFCRCKRTTWWITGVSLNTNSTKAQLPLGPVASTDISNVWWIHRNKTFPACPCWISDADTFFASSFCNPIQILKKIHYVSYLYSL